MTTNRVGAYAMMKRSEQVKRATCAIVSMIECALIGLALWSAHSNVFSSVGLAFAAGMMLVILFLLIIEKTDETKVVVQPLAVAPSSGTSTGTARSTLEDEAPKADAPMTEAPMTNGNGSLPIGLEQPTFPAR